MEDTKTVWQLVDAPSNKNLQPLALLDGAEEQVTRYVDIVHNRTLDTNPRYTAHTVHITRLENSGDTNFYRVRDQLDTYTVEFIEAPTRETVEEYVEETYDTDLEQGPRYAIHPVDVFTLTKQGLDTLENILNEEPAPLTAEHGQRIYQAINDILTE